MDRNRPALGSELLTRIAFPVGGVHGDGLLARLLAAVGPGWSLFDDWSTPDGRDATDHVVIGPGGVHLVDVRAWDGSVGVDVGGQLAKWRNGEVDGRQPEPGRLRRRAVRWEARLLTTVRPVLGFDGATLLHPATGVACEGFEHAGLTCCTSASLPALLTARRPVLVPEQVAELVGAVRLLGPHHRGIRPAGPPQRWP